MTVTPQEYLAALQEEFTKESDKYVSQINNEDLLKANMLRFSKIDKIFTDITNSFSDPNTQDNLYKSYIFRLFMNNLTNVYNESISEGECNVGTIYLRMKNYISEQLKITREWQSVSIQNLRYYQGLNNLQAEREIKYRQLKGNLDQQLLCEFQHIIQNVRKKLQNSDNSGRVV
ncbi:hypothetical protein H6G93_02495 [Nostoc sp. FACHB-973]|nr:hypothetical protein [Nostoc sp. FACHB-973]